MRDAADQQCPTADTMQLLVRMQQFHRQMKSRYGVIKL
jgi:hypothetical protein